MYLVFTSIKSGVHVGNLHVLHKSKCLFHEAKYSARRCKIVTIERYRPVFILFFFKRPKNSDSQIVVKRFFILIT